MEPLEFASGMFAAFVLGLSIGLRAAWVEARKAGSAAGKDPGPPSKDG